ncbi:MAG: hypothetical protein B6230_05555 [Desulfobacteraceae bacterium 4572_89]|nr:MAG: hypothetical protein B6230_05555 [Desulfobacteraceae bacterium 4572_89]
MKKEYAILAVIILALSAYLAFKKDNQSNYTLPESIIIDSGEIDRIMISKGDKTIELFQKDDTWVLTDKEFSADMPSVNNILDVIRNLKITDLISENKDFIRYELDAKNSIGVKAFKGSGSLMEFKIGKTAPSLNHTFVMLANDKNIYQADKSFRDFFDKSIDNLRDKKVLSFKEDSIKKLILEKDGIVKTLKTSESKDDKGKPFVSWKFEDGSSPDKETMDNLLSSLSFLKCKEFSDSLSKADLEKETSLCKITLENDTLIVLNLFDGENEDKIMAASSMSLYSFFLESFTAKDILSYVDKLAGLKKEEKK